MPVLKLQNLLAVVVALASTCAPASTPTHRLNVHIEGEGSPTIIFAAGLGETLDSWKAVQGAIAAHCARTLTYSRAGYPDSKPASGPRDAETIVQELRAELQARGVQPPYVLVGHSLGGLYMQYFARQHASEVAGLVLVDSTHWNQQLQMGTDATLQTSGRQTVMLYMPLIVRRELADSARAGEQVRSSPLPGDFPTVVLSSTRALRDETPATRAAAARLQDEIAAEYPTARHVRVAGSGHYIQIERPEVVIESVRAVARCGALT